MLNEGFVGPTPIHVIQMYLDVFRQPDDVDSPQLSRAERAVPCEARHLDVELLKASKGPIDAEIARR